MLGSELGTDLLKTGKKIAFTGGGSGGHTMPALAFIEYLKAQGASQPFNSMIYLGSKTGIESHLLTMHKDIAYFPISTGKLRRYWTLENLKDLPKIIKGFFDSIAVLKKQKPDLLLSFGGFVSVPPSLAAFFLRIPVIIHEQTVNVGLANRINSMVAQKIAISFPSSLPFFPTAKTVFTGLPIRPSLLLGSRENLQKYFNFENSTLPLLYITGGGLGSEPINKVVKEILPQLLTHFRVIHQTGEAGLKVAEQSRQDLKEELKHLYFYKAFFTAELPDILAATDILLGRSGAGIVNECEQLKIPALFIPLPFATKNEQFLNAQYLADQHKAEILEQKNLTGQSLLSQLLKLNLSSPAIRKVYEGQSVSTNASQKLLELGKTVLRIT